MITSPLLFAQTTAIPDPNFEQALIDLGLDDVLDGEVLSANIDTVESLIVPNKNISELTGIEDFTSLVWLDCDSNQLTSLNVSQNVALRTFACGANRLTSLRLVDNTELRSLRCEQNQLTSLNLANGNNSLLTNVSATENNLDCIQIDEGFTPPNDSSWLKDDTASYSSLCP